MVDRRQRQQQSRRYHHQREKCFSHSDPPQIYVSVSCY
jgi:hypothetical protein